MMNATIRFTPKVAISNSPAVLGLEIAEAKPEDDWWTIDAAYVVNKHLTVAAGYGHFGDVLNHEANNAWGLTVKYEF